MVYESVGWQYYITICCLYLDLRVRDSIDNPVLKNLYFFSSRKLILVLYYYYPHQSVCLCVIIYSTSEACYKAFQQHVLGTLLFLWYDNNFIIIQLFNQEIHDIFLFIFF